MHYERRRDSRRSHASEVQLRIFTLGGYVSVSNERASCRTGDVSMRGMLLHTRMEVPVGTALELRVQLLPGDPEIVRRGEVRWVETHADGTFGLGVQFTSTSLEERAAWHAGLMRLRERDTADAEDSRD